jgi:hypothetical protein
MAKMTFSSPTTDSQRQYFARSASMRFWAGLMVMVVPIVWGAADYIGLCRFITPQYPLLSGVVTAGFLLFAHGILIHSAKMVGYDLFDNYRVENKLFALLPIFLTCGLLWFSWIGSEQIYLERFAHKAVTEKTEGHDKRKADESKAINAAYDTEAQRIKDNATRLRKAKSQPYNAQIANLESQRRRAKAQGKETAWYNQQIAAQETASAAAIAPIDQTEADDLQRLSQNVNGQLAEIANQHKTVTSQISERNSYEKGKETADIQASGAKSFWFSLCLAILFWASVLVRTRLDAKSGILPSFEHTDGNKFDLVRQTSFVFSEIVGSQYSRILGFLHNKGATTYREITPKRQIVSQPAPPTPPSVLPPPMPPLPPTSGNGGGGNGGSMPPPPAPIPQNGEILKYYHKAQPVEGRVKHKAHFNEMTESQKTAVIKNKIENLREPCEFQEHFDAYQLINPFIYILVDDTVLFAETDEENAADNLAQKFADKRLLPTLSINQGAVDFELSTPPLTVITEPKTVQSVITDITPVITAIEGESSSEFHYGDRLLKELKRAANVEVKNWENMNGTPKSIRERCIAKSSELDEAVRKVRASSEVRQTVCNYFADNISPIIRSKVEEWNKEGKKS